MRASEVEAAERALGARLRAVRRDLGLSQAEVARRASVSRRAIVNLEAGAGSSLATLVRVLGALDRTDWIDALAVPEPAFNPLDLLGPDVGAERGTGRGRP